MDCQAAGFDVVLRAGSGPAVDEQIRVLRSAAGGCSSATRGATIVDGVTYVAASAADGSFRVLRTPGQADALRRLNETIVAEAGTGEVVDLVPGC